MPPPTYSGGKPGKSWPPIMIEVEYSQSTLHLNAEWLPLNSSGKTRFVIIVKLTIDPYSLRIECWQGSEWSDQSSLHSRTGGLF